MSEPINDLDVSVTEPDDQNSSSTEPKQKSTVVSRAALEAERELHRAAKQREKDLIEKYKDVDVDKFREYQQKVAELEQKELEAARDWETLKSKRQEEIDAAAAALRDDYEKRLQTRDEKLRELLVETELIKEFGSQKGKPKQAEIFNKIARDYIDLSLDGDAVTVEIKDGKSASIAELVSNLKNTEEFGVFFDAVVPAGSGTPAAKVTGSQGSAGKTRENMSSAEKAEYVEKYGGMTRKVAGVPCLIELPQK